MRDDGRDGRKQEAKEVRARLSHTRNVSPKEAVVNSRMVCYDFSFSRER